MEELQIECDDPASEFLNTSLKCEMPSPVETDSTNGKVWPESVDDTTNLNNIGAADMTVKAETGDYVGSKTSLLREDFQSAKLDISDNVDNKVSDCLSRTNCNENLTTLKEVNSNCEQTNFAPMHGQNVKAIEPTISHSKACTGVGDKSVHDFKLEERVYYECSQDPRQSIYFNSHHEERIALISQPETTASMSSEPLNLTIMPSSTPQGFSSLLKIKIASTPTLSDCNSIANPSTIIADTNQLAQQNLPQSHASNGELLMKALHRRKSHPTSRKAKVKLQFVNEMSDEATNVTAAAPHSREDLTVRPNQNVVGIQRAVELPSNNVRLATPVQNANPSDISWWSQYSNVTTIQNSAAKSSNGQPTVGSVLYKCQICGVGFVNPTALALISGKYACVGCAAMWDQCMSQNATFQRTVEFSFKCTECGEEFQNKRSLAHHSRFHAGTKRYNCVECNATFSRKCHLTTHQLLHTGVKPYKCKVCEATFTHKTSLKDHILQHTGEKPYKCLECGAAFGRKGHLNTHSLIHSGKTPYKCSICGNSFTHKTSLQDHMLQHSGEKPHKCPECGAAFTRRGHLNTHSIIHTRKRLLEGITSTTNDTPLQDSTVTVPVPMELSLDTKPIVGVTSPPLPMNLLSKMLGHPTPPPPALIPVPVTCVESRPGLPELVTNTLPSHLS